MRTFLGVDLTMSEKSASAWAALDEDAHIAKMGLAQADADILMVTDEMQPAVVAIDAPLYLPRGLTSLDDPDAARNLPTGRSSERALKLLGIGCFYTTPASIIKPMVYRAIRLRQTLEARGLCVLEIFPYASKVRMLGTTEIPQKTTVGGRRFLQGKLSSFIAPLPLSPLLSHDELDALVAAYTALLYGRGDAEPLGEADEGLLWIPRVAGHA